MRLRALPLLALMSLTLAVPASPAQADDASLPCIDIAGVVQVACDTTGDPGQDPDQEDTLPPSAAERRCPGADLTAADGSLAQMRKATTCLVNHERTKRGLKPLKSNLTLTTLAGGYAKKMVVQDFFDHTAPDGSTFSSRIRRTTYLQGSWRRWSIGENIAWGSSVLGSPGAIVDSWMHSAGHKRNILDPAFTEFGMGVAIGAPERGEDDQDAVTYVNEFGQRRR